MTTRSLREDLQAHIQDWVARPTGEAFDNGYCESELLASTVKRILVDKSTDAELVEAIRSQVVFYATDSAQCADELRQTLNDHGVEVSLKEAPQPEGLVKRSINRMLGR